MGGQMSLFILIEKIMVVKGISFNSQTIIGEIIIIILIVLKVMKHFKNME